MRLGRCLAAGIVIAMAGWQPPDDRTELLTIEQRLVGTTTVVSPVGEIDVLTAPGLREALDQAFHGQQTQRRVVLDLSGVAFLGSAGLALLATTATTRGNSSFQVVLGHSHSVRRAIEVAGLDKKLALYDTVDQALTDGGTPNANP
jgi:anti-sigma B factor antagonist